jgi:hypothetical protein
LNGQEDKSELNAIRDEGKIEVARVDFDEEDSEEET